MLCACLQACPTAPPPHPPRYYSPFFAGQPTCRTAIAAAAHLQAPAAPVTVAQVAKERTPRDIFMDTLRSAVGLAVCLSLLIAFGLASPGAEFRWV